jgi:DNA-binding winged helix-turn-helix (wHTH) protein
MRIRFEAFTLDEGRRQLLEKGRAVHLSPKAYELLLVLIEKQPNAISKTDLHERLWPNTFVSEVNLAALVAELRAALGEHGRQGRFIRTVHGFGYAFAFEDVQVEGGVQAAAAPVASASAAAAPAPERVTCWLAWGEREYALKPGVQTVGRDGQAEVRIDALSISRAHARISCGADAVSIEDLQSKNGTWVNGTKVGGVYPLTDGDEVRLGSITLTFRNVSAPRPTATVAPS